MCFAGVGMPEQLELCCLTFIQTVQRNRCADRRCAGVQGSEPGPTPQLDFTKLDAFPQTSAGYTLKVNSMLCTSVHIQTRSQLTQIVLADEVVLLAVHDGATSRRIWGAG